MSADDNPDILDRWKVLASAEPNRQRKAEFGGIGLLFAGKAARKAIWQAKLEGWNVEESTVVKECIAIGEKRGEARAVARGHVKGRVESFFEILSAKFGAVPEDVATTAPDVATFRQQAGI